MPLMIAIFLCSFFLNIRLVDEDPNAAFYSPLTRIWELGAGTIIARLFLDNKIKSQSFTVFQATTISLFGISILLCAIFFVSEQVAFPGWWALLPVTGASCLIIAGMNSWLNSSILASKGFVSIGLISYPLYLWHWPLLSFAQIIEADSPKRIVSALLVLIAILFAFLTYRYIETPIRCFTRGYKVVRLLVILMVLLGVVGFSITKTVFLSETRLSDTVNPEVLKAKGDWEYPGDFKKAKYLDDEIYFNDSPNAEVIMFGDSHIQQYGPRVLSLSSEGKALNVAFMTESGCPPIPNVYQDKNNSCAGNIERFKSYLSDHQSVKSILIGGCWNCYFIYQTQEDPDFGEKRHFYFKLGPEEESFRGGRGSELALSSFIDFVSELSEKYQVYVLLDNPSDIRFDPSSMLPDGVDRRTLTFSKHKYRQKDIEVAIFNQSSNEIELEKKMMDALSESGSILIRQSDLICPENQCNALNEDNIPIYKDHNHIRPFYIRDKMHVIDIVIKK